MEMGNKSETDVLTFILDLSQEDRKKIFEKLSFIEELIVGLEEHITTSQPGIIGLEDDWDGEGARRYRQNAWDRSMLFLRRFLRTLWMKECFLPFPNILPGPEGSIDLNWDLDNVSLLINIPDEKTEPVSFYGEHNSKKEIEGSIEIELVDSLLIPWMLSI